MSDKRKVLITGATGFAGSHLIEFLVTKDNLSIWGTKRTRSDMSMVSHLQEKVKWIEMNVIDPHNVHNAISEVNPDYVFHLAAQSFVPTSWKAPQETFLTNIIGTLNLLEALKNINRSSRIQIAGSSEEYGEVKPEETPITESNLLKPLSPYGVSKVACDLTGRQYVYSYGMNIVVTRAFNHTGPRRGEMFATSSFAKQIAEIEKGLREPVVYIGNLEAKRDFSDVRDVVRAYWLALEKGIPNEVYNICSGRALSIKDVLDQLLQLSLRKDIEIRQDAERMRPSDVPLLLGDCSKFKKQTGWEPKIPWAKTLADLLEYWRERVGKGSA